MVVKKGHSTIRLELMHSYTPQCQIIGKTPNLILFNNFIHSIICIQNITNYYYVEMCG